MDVATVVPGFWQLATAQLQQLGWRRLVVFSGDVDWCQQQLAQLQQQIAGDWGYFSLNCASHCQQQPVYHPQNIHTLLGQEIAHVAFDCHQGLHAEALAILAGAMQAGSWLVLLAPAWQQWPQQPDKDSQRWQDQGKISATPYFIDYLQSSLIAQQPQVICHQQGYPLTARLLVASNHWQPLSLSPAPTVQQHRVLRQLLASRQAVNVLTAARGRGKSSVAAWLINASNRCWVTAPSRQAVNSMQRHCQQPLPFIAPDKLLADCQQQGRTAFSSVDWLIIDEAAMLPVSLLNALISFFPRVLLLTTIQGYEGTGQGFILKFCQQLTDYQLIELQQPMRWAEDDPLEAWINRLLLFDYSPLSLKQLPLSLNKPEPIFNALSVTTLRKDCPQLQAIYQLLVQAHYRTTPLDWRRLLDADNIDLATATIDQRLIAAIWLQQEGGLSTPLAKAVWAGVRRPRGNLVAQSLAAHAGVYWAAQLVSYRVSRIAVDFAYRRQGYAKQLIEQQMAKYRHQSVDYLSASFALNAELAAFWQACGWQIVYIGHRPEQISASYQAIALYPLSKAGHRLVEQLLDNWQRDGQLMAWHRQWQLHAAYWPTTKRLLDSKLMRLADWQNVYGFSHEQRSLSSSLAVIYRCLVSCQLPLNPSLMRLKAYILQQITLPQAISQSGCQGKQALIHQWRQQLLQLMQQRVPDVVEQCRSWLVLDDY